MLRELITAVLLYFRVSRCGHVTESDLLTTTPAESRGAQVMHIAAANVFWFLSSISPFMHHLCSMLPRHCVTSDCQWDSFHMWRVAANMFIRNC